MQRIKIPFGGLNATQLEVLADCAEEYSDSIAHITTRQDFQLHFVHIEDTPSIMRRLAAVGITTREACGNTVRNVTACPIAGVCRTQTFDVTPYAKAIAYFMLGHPDTQNFGRKFKIAFSGCKDEACGLVRLHDIGALRRCVNRWTGEARLRDLCRRRARHGAAAGKAASTSSCRRKKCFRLPGHRPRVRAARRKEESQHGATEVPGQQARH